MPPLVVRVSSQGVSESMLYSEYLLEYAVDPPYACPLSGIGVFPPSSWEVEPAGIDAMPSRRPSMLCTPIYAGAPPLRDTNLGRLLLSVINRMLATEMNNIREARWRVRKEYEAFLACAAKYGRVEAYSRVDSDYTPLSGFVNDWWIELAGLQEYKDDRPEIDPSSPGSLDDDWVNCGNKENVPP
jgi:hypothetical protein